MANGHGGARMNAGRPKKDLSTAVMDGTRPSRLKATKFENVPLLVDEQTPTVPECMSYLKEEQHAGVALNAEKFYKDIWDWLVARGCQNLFEVSFLQRYAMQQARYVQLEQLISKLGFLSKTENGGAKDNPLEAIALNRLKLVNTMQQSIENTVRANCAEPFTGMPNTQDPMELILRGG
jgi:hypothetical protein